MQPKSIYYIKEESTNMTGVFTVDLHDDEDSQVGIIESPTLNCQSISIANMYEILMLPKQEQLEVMQYLCKNYIHKPMAIVDINTGVEHLLDALVDNDYIVKTHYKSTNCSDMVLCLINLKQFRV